MAASIRTDRIISDTASELKRNPPRILEKTRAKSGQAAAQAQRTAIILSKSRAKGARIPMSSNVRRAAAQRLLRRS